MFNERSPHITLLIIFAAALCVGIADVRAQFTFASDSSTNTAYSDGWATGDNGGSGFASWTLASGGGTGGFGANLIGDPNAAGITSFGTSAFAQFANSTNTGAFANADRSLSTAMQVGDAFSFQWAINWDSGSGGNKGFNLYTGGVAGTQLINVNNGSSATITINDANTGFTFGTSVMTWTFAYTDATTLIVTANDRDGSGTYSNSFTVAGAVDAFRFYSSSMQSGNQAQPYFNNFSLTNSGLYNVAAAQTEARFLTGSGNLAKTGNGTLTISGTTNNFTGTVGITNGAIRATASSALGSASSVTVQSGAALEYSGGITVARNLTLNGNGISTGGALRNISGDNTHSGAITLGSASRIASDAGSLTVSGNTSGSGLGLTVGGAGNVAIQTAIGIGTGRLTKEDAGTLTLSGANAYSGGTLVSGGRLVGDTRSLQGAITNTASVTFNQTTNGSYTGLMSGAGGTMTKSGNGTVTLTANNTYTGATTIGGGRLVVNGLQSSSAVTISNGSALGGTGTVGALTVSGLLAPGNSIGTLSAGNTTFNGGGSFELEIFDWVNLPGTGWDLLDITGNLTLNNTSGDTFAINLVSLANSATPGLSTDWNPNANFTNTFITYTGGLLGTSFASNLFTVNTGSFSNTINGTFSITNVTNGLALLYTTSFAPPSSTYNWSAGSGLWGTASNWTNNAAPTNGASIIFSGTGGTSTNSSTVSSIQGLVFTNGAGAYTVSGTAMAIGAGGISNASSATQTISNNLSLSANAGITAASGNVTLAGNLTNGGNAVTVGGEANTTVGGVISGSGTLSKLGSGTLLLAGANAYTGTTTISGGSVVASDNTSLGATNGGTTVASGATLELSGGITSAENITITGSGVGGGGAIRSLGDGENTLTGAITLGGNARINVDAPTGSVTTLSSLGSGTFTIVDSFGVTYSQGATNLNLTAAASGGTVAGEFASVADWSAVSTFGLRMSTTSNPNIFFETFFYNSVPEQLNVYDSSTDGLTNVPSVKVLSLLSGGDDLSDVFYMQLKFNGDITAPANLSFIDLVSVPTSGLLVSGNIDAGANVLTLGSAAGSVGTLARGTRLTGVISGSGNTFSNTTTSIVKDGDGTVYLSGNNTFTGDTWILDGILEILAGASTNALGVGSDLFISSLGSLGVAGDVSVSSIQGESESSAGGVVLSDSAILTVNGADKAMTMRGNINGDGGLRLVGNAGTVLTLTGNNEFVDNTTITGGTIVLAGAEGDQALRNTANISVASGAKLLLQSSDQVYDLAGVSLSGGTIQRASGVSEAFGNLNLTTDSFLDFGTGEVGTLRFGTYNTPSSLLTVQNFLPGNKLQFGSTLTEGQLNNPALFSFSNGFTTGTESGFFTITAIPEPSTYVAALGLLGLMLWSWRRRRAPL